MTHEEYYLKVMNGKNCKQLNKLMMGETETHMGKLKRINCDSQNEFAAGVMQNEGEMPSYYDNPLKWMLSEYGDKYISISNGLWEVIENLELDPDDDINDLRENEDGTINFISRFYNGGTCLSEMLEEGLTELNK